MARKTLTPTSAPGNPESDSRIQSAVERVAQLETELDANILESRAGSERINRAQILAGFNIAIADVLTMCGEYAEFAKSLDRDTLRTLQWLQREIAEQASAVLCGYMPADFPPGHDLPWKEVQS